MKKLKLNISLRLPDDFKIGDCKHCPLHSYQSQEVSYQTYEESYICKLGYSSIVCPLEETNYEKD